MPLLPRPKSAAPTTIGTALADAANPVRAVLDSLDANCFVADRDLTLVYLNRKAADTARSLDGATRKSFGVGFTELLGGSIHRFHRDPAKIERILADERALPRAAVFTFGGITLRTHIAAIRDDAGAIHGYCVVWENVSERNASAKGAVDRIEAAAVELGTSSEHLASVSGETALRAADAQSITDDLRQSIAEIGRSSAEASTVLNDAVHAVRESGDAIAALTSASSEIGDVLKLITQVAEQTKLLALNATIEAARAGEAGKGFAVVADEVKQLAGATAASTEDIDRRVQAIQTGAAQTQERLAVVRDLIDRIETMYATVAAAIEEQVSATGEFGSAVADIARGAADTTARVQLMQSAIASTTSGVQELHDMVLNS